MGIDPVHLINHNLWFKHTDEFIAQVQQKTGMPVFTERVYDDNRPSILAPPGFTGWLIQTENDLSLQQYFETGELMELYAEGMGGDGLSMYVNPHLLKVYCEDFYMGRWSSVKYLADWIYENGIPAPEDYETIPVDVKWIFEHRKNLFDFFKLFGTQHPKMLTFCNDKHQEWLDYFFEPKWSMDDFINWSKKELIHVKFSELVNFNFPNEQPGYFNVCIEDDFEDLKQADRLSQA